MGNAQGGHGSEQGLDAIAQIVIEGIGDNKNHAPLRRPEQHAFLLQRLAELQAIEHRHQRVELVHRADRQAQCRGERIDESLRRQSAAFLEHAHEALGIGGLARGLQFGNGKGAGLHQA